LLGTVSRDMISLNGKMMATARDPRTRGPDALDPKLSDIGDGVA
jgi:hypothetical protein